MSNTTRSAVYPRKTRMKPYEYLRGHGAAMRHPKRRGFGGSARSVAKRWDNLNRSKTRGFLKNQLVKELHANE